MLDRSLTRAEIEGWLRERDPARRVELRRAADEARRRHVGDAVHLRGLLEISNHCARNCAYCGLRADHPALPRYRMTMAEIMAGARTAVALGYGTVVLQAGEDYGLERDWIAEIVRAIKRDTPLAVTLSLGERPVRDLRTWRAAGADRYLLRFETSDPDLYAAIHPPLRPGEPTRLEVLRTLRALGYEIGGGVMVGIPGQTYAMLARDIETFRALDLDMIGVGPFIANPDTPLGRGECPVPACPPEEQVPATAEMACAVLALTRLVCPEANLPSTTALATIETDCGRVLGLTSGANVVMPNLTPVRYRELYRIYPGKAVAVETAEACDRDLRAQLAAIGRTVGEGPGGRMRHE